MIFISRLNSTRSKYKTFILHLPIKTSHVSYFIQQNEQTHTQALLFLMLKRPKPRQKKFYPIGERNADTESHRICRRKR